MFKLKCKTFTDPVTGTSCEGERLSGRDSVEVQRRPGRYPETDPNLGDITNCGKIKKSKKEGG